MGRREGGRKLLSPGWRVEGEEGKAETVYHDGDKFLYLRHSSCYIDSRGCFSLPLLNPSSSKGPGGGWGWRGKCGRSAGTYDQNNTLLFLINSRRDSRAEIPRKIQNINVWYTGPLIYVRV